MLALITSSFTLSTSSRSQTCLFRLTTSSSRDYLVDLGGYLLALPCCRYFVCRALQFDPRGWLRMAVHNGSITVLLIKPSGRVSLLELGGAGHFPPEMLTFN